MACGDRYRYLIRNARGRTYKDPCKLFCGELDYLSWYESANELLPRVAGQWGRLRRIEGDDHARSDALVPEITSYERHTRDLIHPARAILWEPGLEMEGLVDTAIAAMQEGACMLEKVADAITELGAKVPDVPSVGEFARPDAGGGGTIWDSLKTGATLAVIGVAGYGMWWAAKRTRQIDA